MHILFITSYYPSEALPVTGIFFHDQASALHAAGHQLGVITTPRINISVELARRHGWSKLGRVSRDPYFTEFPVYRMHWGWFPRPLPPAVMLLTVSTGLRAFDAYCRAHGRPDVIHAQNIFYAGALAARIKQKYGVPVVLTEHSSSFLEGKIIFPGQPAIIRETLRTVDARLVVGNSLIEPLHRYAREQPIEVIGNIVDTDFFTHGDPPPAPNPFVFVLIAQLKERRKGFDTLLKAFRQAFGDAAHAPELHIRGSGPLQPELDQLIAALGIGAQVRFLPLMTREELRALMRRSHALVSSSSVETFGVSVAEAMACGTPVVATRSGGPEDFVTERSGILIPANDIPALADALCRMVAERGRFQADEVRAEVVARYSRAAYVARLESIYTQITRSKVSQP